MSTVTLKFVKGDVPMSSATGRPLTVTGKEKFSQDIKMVIDIDSNLNGLVGQVGDIFSIRAEMLRRLENGFALYQATQDAFQRTDRDLVERFGRIAQLVVAPLKDGQGYVSPTDFGFRVDVLSADKTQPATTSTGVLVR